MTPPLRCRHCQQLYERKGVFAHGMHREHALFCSVACADAHATRLRDAHQTLTAQGYEPLGNTYVKGEQAVTLEEIAHAGLAPALARRPA